MEENKLLRFQIHVVEHCNLHCKGCYHFSPLAKEVYLDIEEYKKDIIQLSTLFGNKMDRIMLLGGEPLLHPEIEKFFEVTRNSFTEGEIRILTNGILLLKQPKSFYEALIKYKVDLWVTKYPIQFDYNKAEEVAKLNGVKLHYFNQEPVKTLGWQPLDFDGNFDYKENFDNCYRAWLCAALKHGKLFSCFVPAEVGTLCDYFGIQNPVCEDDYVDIYKVKTAEEVLKKMKKPMNFCRYCDRTKAIKDGAFEWQKSKYNIDEWVVTDN